MTLQELMYAGFEVEARDWRRWLLRAIAGDPVELQIMYGVAGERRLPEYRADWLPGYDGNPVRIGNEAVDDALREPPRLMAQTCRSRSMVDLGSTQARDRAYDAVPGVPQYRSPGGTVRARRVAPGSGVMDRPGSRG